MVRKRIHAQVHGRVQGVAFRHYARREALHLGLRGWVRNVADGSVELEYEGYAEDVSQFEAWLRHGPAMAQVRRVSLREVDVCDEDAFLELDFQIRPTI